MDFLSFLVSKYQFSAHPKLHRSSLFASAFFCLLFLQAVSYASAGPLTIRGHLGFPRGKVTLPPNSTYRVELRDVSRMDGPSEHLHVYEGNADKAADGELLDFEIVVPDKEKLSKAPRSLALSAVVNVGWRQQEGRAKEWIRKGDYLSTVTQFLEIPEGDSIDNLVLHLVQYTR
ncbi:hypothetical protein ACSSS7_006473 [Eimeria intestinalis]